MRTRSSVGTASLVVALGVGALCGAAVVGWIYTRPPSLGREQADAATTALAAALGLLCLVCATGCAAHLFALSWLVPGAARSRRRLSPDEAARIRSATGPHWRAAHAWARPWAIGATVLVVVNAADANGFPLSYAVASFSDFFVATQTAQAWALTAVGAIVVAFATWRRRRWRVGVVLTALVLGLSLPTVVTAAVSVGHDHDLATDAATVFTLATVVWFAAVWGAAVAHREGVGDVRVARRVVRITAIALAVALPTRIGVAAYELAGTSPERSLYGVADLVLVGLLLALGLTVLVPRRSTLTARALVVVVLGVQAAMVHLAPPRFFAPQTPEQNFLGFDVPRPPDLATIWLPGRPNVLLTTVAITAIVAYAVGVARLRRRGDAWPVLRLVAWTAGWLVVLMVSGTRIWMYSAATFSWHMAAHMTLNMLAPPLLVLGGPLTLILRSRAGADAEALPGVRDATASLLGSVWVRRLLNPLLIWAVFVGSFYVLYFSPLFGLLMRYHWAHQLMTFHFLIIGYLFYGLAIGVDRPPRDVPPVARLAVVFAAMPFHAFFAIAVIAGNTVIGQNFYESLGVGWMHNLANDQQVGGQIAWATGELPLLVVIVSLVAQWFRQDQRHSRRIDRSVAAGTDTSLAAYNEMLASFAEREERSRSMQP